MALIAKDEDFNVDLQIQCFFYHAMRSVKRFAVDSRDVLPDNAQADEV